MVTLGGADVDSLEAKLYDAIIKNDEAKIPQETKNHLQTIMNSPSKESVSVSLTELLNIWLKIVLSSEQNSLIKRVDYIITSWRVAIAISLVIDRQDKVNIDIVESFVNDLVKQFNNFTLLYFYWISLIFKNSERSLQTAREMEPAFIQVLMGKLVQDFCSMAHYDPGISPENQALLNNSLPPTLYFGPVDLFFNKLSNVITDEVTVNKIKLYLGFILWNDGNRGIGLSHIASGCEYWLNQLSNGISSPVGPDVLLCLTAVVNDITSNNVAPAHDFMKVMCDSLEKHTGASLLHYTYYIFLNQSKEIEDQNRIKSLLDKYPLLPSMKDAEFEKAALTLDMDLESKRNIFNNFIHRNVNRTVNETNFKAVKGSISDTHPFPVSEKVQQELLDIELIQDMQNKKYLKATNTLISSTATNVIPSDIVIMLLVKNLYEQSELSSLEKIRKSLVNSPGVINDIFKAEIKLSMKNTHALWKDSQRQIALEDALIQYQSILTNQNVLSSNTIKSTLTSVLKYIRLYVEELCCDEQNLALDNVETHAKSCYTEFGDASILVLQWEVLFFSHKYSHQILAREFLKRNTKIVDNIDFNKVIDVAVRYKREYFLLELFHISVEYNLSSDIQIKLLSALIDHYCDNSNINAIRSCIKTASQNNIPIPSDLHRKIENAQSKKGLYSKFISFFKTPERD